MKRVINITESDIRTMIGKAINILNEGTVVTFNGEAYPPSGWAVIVVGGVSSGKSTIEKNKLLINGKIINSDHWREMVADVVNMEIDNPELAKTNITKTNTYKALKDKMPDKFDLTDFHHANKADLLATTKKGFNLLQKQKDGLLAANVGKPTSKLPNLLFEIGGELVERIPAILDYLDSFKDGPKAVAVKKTKTLNVPKPAEKKEVNKDKEINDTPQNIFNLHLKSGTEEIVFADTDDLRTKLKSRLPNFSDEVIDKLINNKGNYKTLNESEEKIKEHKGYKVSIVWALSNRQVAFASMLNRDRQLGPVSFHTSHNGMLDETVGVMAVINSVKDRIDEAWCVITSTFHYDDNGTRIDRRLNPDEKHNVYRMERDTDGNFVLPKSINISDHSDAKTIDDIIGDVKRIRTYNGTNGNAKAMPDQDNGEISYEQYPTMKNARDWADTHGGQYLKNVAVYKDGQKPKQARDHSTLFEERIHKSITNSLQRFTKEKLNEYGYVILKRKKNTSPKPYFSAFIDKSNDNRNMLVDLTNLSSQQANLFINQYRQGVKLEDLVNTYGVKVSESGIDVDTRTRLSRYNTLDKEFKNNVSDKGTFRYSMWQFIKDNQHIINAILGKGDPTILKFKNKSVAAVVSRYRLFANNLAKTLKIRQSNSIESLSNNDNRNMVRSTLISNCKGCLGALKTLTKYNGQLVLDDNDILKTDYRVDPEPIFTKGHYVKLKNKTYKEFTEDDPKQNEAEFNQYLTTGKLLNNNPVTYSNVGGATDYLIQISSLLCGLGSFDNIDYYSMADAKAASFYKNREEMFNNKESDLNYYKGNVPGTSTEVITLYAFNDFGGTEILKAGRMSMGSDKLKELYLGKQKGRNGTGEPTPDFIDVDFMDDSKKDFMQITLEHAKQVLTEENFMPDFLICVPSSRRFNEDFIASLSQSDYLNCKAYEAFVVKDWLSYKVDDSTRAEIEKQLEYMNYTVNKDKREGTVDTVMDKIRLGVANTALYEVSKIIDKYVVAELQKKYPQMNFTKPIRRVFIKCLFDMLRKNPSKENMPYISMLQNVSTEKNGVQVDIFNTETNSSKAILNQFDRTELDALIANALIAFKKRFSVYIKSPSNPNAQPLKIQLKSINYQDTSQQMTSLIQSGAVSANSALPGQKLRPLVANVYIINEPVYELTVGGRELINILKERQNAAMAMNEKYIKQTASKQERKVDIYQQRVLLFDDDIDTGSSLRLAINSFNSELKAAGVTNTVLKCLTVYGKPGD